MTTLAAFIRDGFRNQHRQFDGAIKELTEEQLHWIPPNTKANHIGFTLWHYVRTEDNVLQFILQNRKPTVWISGGYFEKFGLDKIAQGTGMPTEDANALRLPPLDDWKAYQQAVWDATDSYLSSVDEAALEATVKVVPFGDIPAHRALSEVTLTHGHGHFGEICMLRVLQGLPSTLG